MTVQDAERGDLYYDPFDYDVDARAPAVLATPARRGAALLQRAVRVLRGEPVRRRARGVLDTDTFSSAHGTTLE